MVGQLQFHLRMKWDKSVQHPVSFIETKSGHLKSYQFSFTVSSLWSSQKEVLYIHEITCYLLWLDLI